MTNMTSHPQPVLAEAAIGEAAPAAAKPKIYAFSNVRGGGDGIAYAIADDGTVLGSHWCSHECYVPHDLGVTEGSRPDRHETYAAHYPNGYEMEFVPSRDVEGHAGLAAAFVANDEAGRKAGSESSTQGPSDGSQVEPSTAGYVPTNNSSGAA